MASVKDLAQGKPLRSPLHPALVHLPIALFPLSLLLDLASHVFDAPDLHLVRGAFITLAAGIATALVAAVFGLVDYTDIRHDHPARKTATLHMVLNLLAVAVFALGLGLRYGAWDHASTPLFPLIVSAVGVALLGYSGYLGGSLVYDDGIGVGRHRRSTPTPTTTLHAPPGTAVPDPTAAASDSRPVAVASADALRDGETLRVDVAGLVLTIAQHAGRRYAVQEFCPHRYGPLSEGRIANGEVVCPWHCSRFALATGKVTAGPAKIDLNCYPVETRDGRIWVTLPGARSA